MTRDEIIEAIDSMILGKSLDEVFVPLGIPVGAALAGAGYGAYKAKKGKKLRGAAKGAAIGGLAGLGALTGTGLAADVAHRMKEGPGAGELRKALRKRLIAKSVVTGATLGGAAALARKKKPKKK